MIEIERLKDRLRNRIAMNERNSAAHMALSMQFDDEHYTMARHSLVRIDAYRTVLLDIETLEKDPPCLCDARGQDPCRLHTK